MTTLSDLVESNPAITFDSERDFTKPCFNCGTIEQPRKLVVVGTWSRKVGNRGKSGSSIERPMCAACVESTAATDLRTWRYVLPSEKEDRFSGWAIVFMDSTGAFATVSDYGSYAYKWHTQGWGPGDFRRFIVHCDGDYVRRKLAPREEYDGEATLKAAKRTIIDQRRTYARLLHEGGLSSFRPNEIGRPLDSDEARAEWDLLKEHSDLDSESDLVLWAQHTRVNYYEGIAQTRPSPQAVAFCERTLPRLQEMLKRQLAAEGIEA